MRQSRSDSLPAILAFIPGFENQAGQQSGENGNGDAAGGGFQAAGEDAVEIVSTTGQPSFVLRSFVLIFVSFFAVTSLLLSATTIGTPSSKSCVVKNKLLLRFVASTMLTITSGFSFLI